MASKVEIIDVSDVVPISPLTPRALFRAIVMEVAAEYEIDPKIVYGDPSEIGYRGWKSVEARKAVANRLHALGMSERRVAEVMHMQLKTVRIYLGTLPRP